MFEMFKKKRKREYVEGCVFHCLKDKCPRWIILTQNFQGQQPTQEGRCCHAWVPILLVEIKNELRRRKKK